MYSLNITTSDKIDVGVFLCRRSTGCEAWKESMNARGNEPNKMAEAIEGRKRIHKLSKLSVSFIVRRSSFHRHSEGSNNNKKTKQTVSQISNCYFYYFLFFMGGPLRGSVGGVRGPVRTVVRGPGP